MLDKVFSGLAKSLNTSELMAKKISRRDFLKGISLVFAFLSLSNIAGVVNRTRVVTKEVVKTSGGYGNSGYGV